MLLGYVRHGVPAVNRYEVQVKLRGQWGQWSDYRLRDDGLMALRTWREKCPAEEWRLFDTWEREEILGPGLDTPDSAS